MPNVAADLPETRHARVKVVEPALDLLDSVADAAGCYGIAAGLVTEATASAWPDLIVGLGIFALNLDASRQVYGAARDERLAAYAQP
jgi:Co/Zn/Cd efflux system component